MKDDTLMVVLNPRYLPECLLSIEQIDRPKVWLKNFTERQLEEVIPQVIRETDYGYYVVVSDDCIVSTNALDTVSNALRRGVRVATGYCNLDPITEWTSITKSPPKEPYGTEATYDWMSLADVHRSGDELIRTYHPSFALTGMRREMWVRFPWHCFDGSGEVGWAADLDLSIRLCAANVPIYALKKAFIWHTKPDWQLTDSLSHERRALRVGLEPAEIVYEI